MESLGAPPPNLSLNSTGRQIKRIQSHGLRPWEREREWEEPAWAHARFARVSPCREKAACWEKAAGLRPATRWGAPLCFYLVAMGTTARLAPRLTHCSWPQTPSVGASRTKYDTSWRHPSCPKTVPWAVTTKLTAAPTSTRWLCCLCRLFIKFHRSIRAWLEGRYGLSRDLGI